MWRNITKAMRGLRSSLAEKGTSYRPDLYYMRGPGPKWHAKYGNLAPKSLPATASRRHPLRAIQDRV